MAEQTIEAALEGLAHGPDWSRDEAGDWRAEADGGRLVGVLRRAGGAWEARVYRNEPEPQEAHGPTVFESVDEALDYVEGNLGW